MSNPMSWTERRTLALKIADATPGFDRVPAPERTVLWPGRTKDFVQPPYVLTTSRGQRSMSRQERRQREREEERPPVLSAALENELKFKGDGGIFMRRVGGRPSYIVGFVGATRERAKRVSRAEALKLASLGLAAL